MFPKRKWVRWTLGSLAGLIAAIAILVQATLGWGMVVGILRYDTRQEGVLAVGMHAPVAVLHGLENGEVTRLFEQPPARPVVLVFGSFT